MSARRRPPAQIELFQLDAAPSKPPAELPRVEMDFSAYERLTGRPVAARDRAIAEAMVRSLLE